MGVTKAPRPFARRYGTPRPTRPTAELAFLTRALKAPTLRESVTRLAEPARAESWMSAEISS
jgi:hypothetical protein